LGTWNHDMLCAANGGVLATRGDACRLQGLLCGAIRRAETTFKRERAILFLLRTAMLHATVCYYSYLLRREVVLICHELIPFIIVFTSIFTRYSVPIDLLLFVVAPSYLYVNM